MPLSLFFLSVVVSAQPSGAIDRVALDAALAATNHAPAVAAAVLKDGKTVWLGGKGANRATVFRLGSLTKAFTATMILQMASEGRLVLDEPVAKTLPELPGAWKGVTIRQLLNHTSGVPDYTSQADYAAHMGERLTPAQFVGRVADRPLDFPPGSKYAYDNTGYIVLGMVVERIDGHPFAESLQDRILRPLGMRRTRLDVGGDKPEALGFDAEGKPAKAVNMSQPSSAGAMVSTAEDMAKWVAAQGSPRLMPAWCWAEMWKPGILTDGRATGYGFAWELGRTNDFPTLSHGGLIQGYSAYLRIVPSKRIAALALANSEDEAATISLPGRLLEIVDPSLRAPTVSDPDPRVSDATLGLLRQLERGEPNMGMMSSELASRFTPELTAQLQQNLKLCGEFKGLQLVAVDGPRRTYLARYEKISVKLAIAVDEEGRFTKFSLSAS